TNPCPAFQVGGAFQNMGVAVHNVSGSFTTSTELPRMSFVNPTQPTLDMATVIYDGTACKGSEPCDTTSKFGVRQWGNSTLGYTPVLDRKSTRLNSSHVAISYAVFCLKKKKAPYRSALPPFLEQPRPEIPHLPLLRVLDAACTRTRLVRRTASTLQAYCTASLSPSDPG